VLGAILFGILLLLLLVVLLLAGVVGVDGCERKFQGLGRGECDDDECIFFLIKKG
jgi:hypothetical protein